MPLRSRLRNSGLKLKIPVQRASNGVSSSPYAGGRHSASPGRRGETRACPAWPVEERKREERNVRVGSFPPPVPTFDASVDHRPIWDVKSDTPRTDTDGFRAIPIQYDQQSPIHDGEPVSPELDSIVPQFRGSPLHSELQRLNQRARHLRHWFRSLSPGDGEERDKPLSSNYSYSQRYLSSPVPRFRARGTRSPSSSVATSNDSILTPTENIDNPLGGAARRDSQGVLQSPDVLDPAKEDGFYLLKKDSQRRATLGKILKDDKHRICREWQSLLLKDVHDFCLTEQHLATLVEGMKGHIEGSHRGALEKAVQELRNALDYDGAMLNHLQLALYKVPEALNKVLRGHSIKPHWMFALEDLVRTAVQEAIVILSPELGVHLGTVNNLLDQPVAMHQEHHEHQVPDLAHDNEGGSTSGVSTVNSGFHGAAAGGHGLVSNLGRLREENRHLLTDLVRAQENYQELLKQSLAEQRLHLQMLSQSLAASSITRGPVQRQEGVVDQPGDPLLVDWLSGLELSRDSMERILAEDLTLSDMLDLMSRDDLKRLGLKAGPELRVWRAILTHRNIPLTPTSS